MLLSSNEAANEGVSNNSQPMTTIYHFINKFSGQQQQQQHYNHNVLNTNNNNNNDKPIGLGVIGLFQQSKRNENYYNL